VTESPGPAPEIRLYGRAGCHLCDEARAILDALLAERAGRGEPTAPLVEVDIEADPVLHRRFLTTIPVIEAGDRRLELATSPARIRRLLAETLDDGGVPAPTSAEATAR
jgi:hypothetical protein